MDQNADEKPLGFLKTTMVGAVLVVVPTGQDGGRQFRPVLVDLYGSDSRAVGFEIELLEDGKVAVFLPSVPAATIGQVQLVPQDRVYPLKASMHATLEALTMFGMGASKLVTTEADERTEEGEIPGQS